MPKTAKVSESREVLIAEIDQLEQDTYQAQIIAGLNPHKVQTVDRTKLTVVDLKERRDRLKQRLEAGYDVAARDLVVSEFFRELTVADASR
ncbi:MAG: hypothetical protein ABIS59_03785 [Candidatus Saccharibacteria bacterium]